MWVTIFENVVFDALWLRWIMFFVGNTCVCIGVALFFRTYMPHEAYELIVTEISKTYKFKPTNVKWIYDISSLVVSVVLALSLFGDVTTFEWGKIYEQSYHFIGLGTIIAAFISAPIIQGISKLFDYIFGEEPLIKPLHKFLEGAKNKDLDEPIINTEETTETEENQTEESVVENVKEETEDIDTEEQEEIEESPAE